MSTVYSNGSQERLLDVILALAGNEFMGLAPSEIATAVGANASNITRDLGVLHKKGWAEPIPESGRWRLGPKPVQVGVAFMESNNRIRARFDEMTNRYTRKP